ncbi:hypothetical protein [Emticicia oligotrophica]|nr:hypothetical protein [Emticicia oligotrophica]
MLVFIILVSGVLLTILGLYLGLKHLDPKYFNATVGSIIAIFTLFSVFGNLSKEISSSQTQKEIKENTERTLQPLSITSLLFTLEYKFDNPKLVTFLKNIYSLKAKQEKLLRKSSTATNGQREIEILPGLTFFEFGDEITGSLIIDDPNFLKSCNFPFPKITLKFSPQYPKETKISNGDGTYTVNVDFPVSLELEANKIDAFTLNQVIVDFKESKVTATIQPLEWKYNLDNGKIVSFKDLFGKYLMLSAYYPYWKDNITKFSISSMTLVNERKKLNFTFTPEEKSGLSIVFNAEYLHKITDSDFYK